MSISVQCPGCEKKLKAKDDLAGKRGKCPGCGHVILVPSAQAVPQSKAISPPQRKPPVPSKAEGVTHSPPMKAPAAKVDSSATPSPVSQRGRVRWHWYAGGSAALCVVAAMVFIAVIAPATNDVAKDDKQSCKELKVGDTQKSADNKADLSTGKTAGATGAPTTPKNKAQLFGEWKGKFDEGSVELDFKSSQSSGRETVGVLVRAPSGRGYTVFATWNQINATGNEVKIGGSAVAKFTPDGALLLSGELRSTPHVFSFSEDRLEHKALVGPGLGVDSGGGITKQKVLGEWEGTQSDGAIVALEFDDNLAVVSILTPGTDREKARELAKWAREGGGVRGFRPGGGSQAENVEAALWAQNNFSGALGEGSGIGSIGYEVDADKGEVKICWYQWRMGCCREANQRRGADGFRQGSR